MRVLSYIKQWRLFVAVCVLVIYNIKVDAQDLHFSQFFNSPLTTNPANTGFIPDADYRVGANYRNQWVSVMDVPYKTISVFGDAQVFRNRIENGWVGLGGVILRDVAGSGNLTSTKVYGSMAYHQMLGYASLLSAGFNVGWSNKRIDPTRLKFPDQFNQETGFFDAGVPTNVVFNSTSTSYMDIQVGMNYAYFPNDRVYLNGGFSVHHLNRPKETFFSEGDFENRLAMRYIGFLNASLKVNDLIIVNPMAYYTNQSSSSEWVAGASLNYNLSGDGETQVIGGLFYRGAESIIPLVGFQWRNFRMSFTYDVTTSPLSTYNNSRGAIEFSLIRHGFYDEYDGNQRQSLCPKF